MSFSTFISSTTDLTGSYFTSLGNGYTDTIQNAVVPFVTILVLVVLIKLGLSFFRFIF